MPKKRIFIALPVTKEFSSALQEKLKPFLDLPIRFSKPELWHLTLLFLGYLAEEEIKEVESIVEEAGEKFTVFALKSLNITLFPKTQPRMLWLNFKENKIYNELVDWLEERINFFKKENRTINIHLTLARFDPREGDKIQKKIEKLGLDAISNFEKEILADRIQIMESKPDPRGTTYEIIKEHRLCEKYT